MIDKNIVIGIIIIIVLVSLIYIFFFTGSSSAVKDSDSNVERNRKSQYLFFPKEKSSKETYHITQDYIRKPSQEEMSVSLTVRVSNWYHNFDHWKHVLHKGTEITSSTNKKYNTLRLQSPGIWFHPKINNIRFVLSVYSDFKFKHKYCDLENIPIGKAFHIAFTVKHNTISIYIDGSLVKTCVFEGIPILTEGDVYVNYGITYDGTISKLQLFDRALSIDEIKHISNQ